jgi:uncharacterized protein YecE (DUF72 family)
MAADLRIGISGWTYAPWRGMFYPPGLARKRELAHAARVLRTIEINGSFYSLQRPSSWAAWAAATPDDFVFAVKGSRFVTHMKKLRDVRAPLANFFAQGLLQLGPKLGPILWQLPPQLPFIPDRVDEFLGMLPRTTFAAAALAGEHDERMIGRAWTEAAVDLPLRHAMEVRHPTFLDPAFPRLLRRHGVALVFADAAGRWPYAEDVTADFAYLRLHGARQLYASRYTDDELDWWAARIRAWSAGAQPPDARTLAGDAPPPAAARDVYAYFDNDAKVHAPFDARRLAMRLDAVAEGGRDDAVWSREPPPE